MGALMDYAELAVQFGYITLFVVAFPLAPLLALANNYVEARSDAFKLLTQMQRPVPRGAEDIGSWQGVFTTISCIAVVTNSALVRIVAVLPCFRPKRKGRMENVCSLPIVIAHQKQFRHTLPPRWDGPHTPVLTLFWRVVPWMNSMNTHRHIQQTLASLSESSTWSLSVESRVGSTSLAPQ